MNGICTYHGKSSLTRKALKTSDLIWEKSRIRERGVGGERGTGKKVKSRGEWKKKRKREGVEKRRKKKKKKKSSGLNPGPPERQVVK